MNAKLAGAILGMGMAVAAQAETYHFTPLINKSNAVLQSLGQQLTMDVTSGTSGNVLFTFTNPGSIASVINKVYLSDASSTLLGTPLTITSSPTVHFHQGTAPPVLPGNGIPTAGFSTTNSVGANLPQTVNGVKNSTGAAEFLTLSAPLSAGQTFANVINSLNSSGTSTNANFLRVGLRVIGLGGGTTGVLPQRASFINTGIGTTGGGGGGGATPPPPIPEPETYSMLLAGLGLMAALARRRNRPGT